MHHVAAAVAVETVCTILAHTSSANRATARIERACCRKRYCPAGQVAVAVIACRASATVVFLVEQLVEQLVEPLVEQSAECGWLTQSLILNQSQKWNWKRYQDKVNLEQRGLLDPNSRHVHQTTDVALETEGSKTHHSSLPAHWPLQISLQLIEQQFQFRGSH